MRSTPSAPSRPWIAVAVLIVAGYLAGATGSSASPAQATIVFHHATVLTMDAQRPRAEAIALRGDRILALGSNEEIRRLVGSSTATVDLGGRTLMPGFVDSHTHLFQRAADSGLTYDQAQDLALANGITAIGEMFVPRSLLADIRALDSAGALRVRTSLYLLASDNCGAVQDDWWAALSPIVAPARMLRIPGVKIFADGGSCGRGAVSWVYPDVGGMGDLWLEQADLDALVRRADERGFQVAIHAIGDRGLDAALAAIASVLQGGENRLRHRIEHNTLVRPDQLGAHARIGAVGTIFGDFGTCAYNAGGFGGGQLAPGTDTYLWRWRELLAANPGAHFGWSSDWPIFTLDPFEHLYGFVTRREVAPDGTVCQPEPEQANDTIQRGAALRLMTIDAAYVLRQDSAIGSLEPGKLADLVVLSDNPLTVPADHLPQLQVLSTLVGGRTEFCASGAGAVCPP
jgi:predicted amidohydrolase YtcJ